MGKKVSVSYDEELLKRVDEIAEEEYGGNRSAAVADLTRLGLEAEDRIEELEQEKERLEDRVDTLVSTNERLSRLLED
jgi:metal-responsive CopG/Arc/MetJ family transcriptional regulator